MMDAQELIKYLTQLGIIEASGRCYDDNDEPLDEYWINLSRETLKFVLDTDEGIKVI